MNSSCTEKINVRLTPVNTSGVSSNDSGTELSLRKCYVLILKRGLVEKFKVKKKCYSSIRVTSVQMDRSITRSLSMKCYMKHKDSFE